MKNFIAYILLILMRCTLWFRYRVKIKGLENLNPTTLNKPGGVLFLPNHPTMFVDPTLITLAIWRKYPLRPLVVEYMYNAPIVRWFMRFLNALPVPKFEIASNSLKKKRSEKSIQIIMEDLRHGQNFLIYPAGRMKLSNKEILGGASGVHQIITSVPEANIVLVRITGLWGSSFSRALSDVAPAMFPTIFRGIKIALKNLLFFTPRRDVTIEFIPAGPNFPYHASRLEMNKYLENWYNRPDELSKTTEPYPGETLNLISYSMWKKELPKITKASAADEEIDLSTIPEKIQQKVKEKLSEMTKIPVDQIMPKMMLASDLGLDSLDAAELIAFLSDEYDLKGIPVNELTTVLRVMAIAAKQIVFPEEPEEEIANISAWKKPVQKKQLEVADGETVIEVFLNNCSRISNSIACADSRSGILTYDQAKMRVILLAEYIRTLPGKYIGIILPASVAAYLTILACQLAGKIPLPINWTVGPRHLDSVNSLSHVQAILSSWSFIDRLENVDFNGMEDKIILLEDVARDFSLKDKILAFARSKQSTSSILRHFHTDTLTKDSQAVLLFTSGTENMPKGVPLTHENILSNQRAAVQLFKLTTEDVLLGILPPFHSFGFTVSGLIPLVSGMKVAYYPDPTNGNGLAKEIDKWSITLLCGAPSFLKAIFKAAQPEQLRTLNTYVTGAEKAPADLFQLASQKTNQAKCVEGYGITECSPILTANTTGSSKYGVGKPMQGVELCIIDINTLQPLPNGQQGLIVAHGPNIFSGYLNIGLTSPFFTINGKQWYNTGDLGYLDEQGNLILAGRLKRFIKVGPEMISLGAIEEALLHGIIQKGILEEAEGPVLAICAKEETGEKPNVVLVSKFSISLDEANKMLKDSGFSNLVRVSQIESVKEIPLLGTGKVNYRALEAKLFG